MGISFRSEELLPDLWDLSRRAGDAILDIYEQGEVDFDRKEDDSPVTAADLCSEAILIEGLRELTPRIPIISEESGSAPWEERRLWRRSWVVDPLDGTREFLGRNGEFTVNIGLVDRGDPILGLIFAPTLGRGWAGIHGPTEQNNGLSGRAWRLDRDGEHRIRVSSTASSTPRVVASRSHRTPELDHLLDRLPHHELVAVGSSLKFCWVAEGKADFYARLSPTMEWDTAAGHAVLKAAGGNVIGPDGRPFRYNRRQLRNGGFVAHGLESEPWSETWKLLESPRSPSSTLMGRSRAASAK